MIADATASGNSLAVNTAATLAPPAGVTQQLAQAASLAVTKYGSNAQTVAGALSQVRCTPALCVGLCASCTAALKGQAIAARWKGRQAGWQPA